MHRHGIQPPEPVQDRLREHSKGGGRQLPGRPGRVPGRHCPPRFPTSKSEWMGAAASRVHLRHPARLAMPTCQWRLLSVLDDGHGFRGWGPAIQAGAAPPLDAQPRRWGELWGCFPGEELAPQEPEEETTSLRLDSPQKATPPP